MANIISTAVFAVYLLVVLGVGIYARQFVEENPLDYYLGSRTVGWVVLGFTIMATIMSAFTFFGIGATASATGLGTFPFIALETVFFALVFGTIGVKISRLGRKFDTLTPAEYLMDRFDADSPGFVYLFIAFAFLWAFVATQIIGGAVALEVLLDIPFTWGAVLITVFMAIYIHLSGFRGVVWSDTIQGAVMFVALVGMFIAALIMIGPQQLINGVQSQSPGLMTYVGPAGVWTPEYTLSFTAVFIIGVTCYPQVYQRFLAAKSDAVLRRSSMLYPALGTIIFFAAVALGVWSKGIIPNPENPDYVIPLMVQQLSGPFVTGVVIAGGVAALMSTADSVVLSLSSMITHDVYKRHINPDASEKREVYVSQIMLLVIILVALALAMTRPASIFDLGSFGVVGHAAAAPALLLSLYWKRSTAVAAVVSTLVSGALMVGSFVGWIPGGTSPFGVHYGFFGMIVSLVLFVVISYLTSSPSETNVDSYLEA